MKKRLMILYITAALLISFLEGGAQVHAQSLIDATADGETGNRVSLGGEWEFYWNKLLTPEDIRHTGLKPAYMQVPSSWLGKQIGGERLPRHGYATYRKLIKVPPEDIGKNKTLYLKYVGSAYKIWIDGQAKNGMGVVGRSAEQETPKLGGNLISFVPKQESIEIVIQVSNYSFRESGIIGEVYVGDGGSIRTLLFKDIFNHIFLIGGFVVIGLYHLIIYVIRRKEVSVLYIGLGAMLAAMRIILINEYLAYLIIPSANWEWMAKIEYLVEIAAFFLVTLLMKALYPEEIHPLILRISYGCAAILAVYTLLTPTRVFTNTMPFHAAIISCFLIYFVFYVGIVAALRKREGARINLVALFIIIVAIVNDTMVYTGAIHTFIMVEYSLLLFILLQAVIISYRYALLKSTLELKVIDRTKELRVKNEELALLQNTRTKMLANIAHDLGSPIVGIQTYLQLMREGLIQNGDRDALRQMVAKSDAMKQLIDELFELSKLESKELTFHFEAVPVKDLIEEIYRRYETDLRRDRFSFRIGVLQTELDGMPVFVRIDRFQIHRVLQNYIGNAVKFSRPGNKSITLNAYIQEAASAAEKGHEIRVEVADQGTGIAPEDLPLVFLRFYKKKEGNPGGSGLGLAISKEIIEQHGGRVGVESQLGAGSTFYFTLPMFDH